MNFLESVSSFIRADARRIEGNSLLRFFRSQGKRLVEDCKYTKRIHIPSDIQHRDAHFKSQYQAIEQQAYDFAKEKGGFLQGGNVEISGSDVVLSWYVVIPSSSKEVNEQKL